MESGARVADLALLEHHHGSRTQIAVRKSTGPALRTCLKSMCPARIWVPPNQKDSEEMPMRMNWLHQ